MTATERAAYLIQELGHVKAEEHALWVFAGAIYTETREYWADVAEEIAKSRIASFEEHKPNQI